MTVETLLTDNDASVLSITFESLGPRNHEATCVHTGSAEGATTPCLVDRPLVLRIPGLRNNGLLGFSE